MSGKKNRFRVLLYSPLLLFFCGILLLNGCMNRSDFFDLLTTPEIIVSQGQDTIYYETGVLDAGLVKVLESKVLMVTIKNEGANDLNITGISLESGDIECFSVDLSMTLSLVGGNSSTSFNLIFAPQDVRAYSAVLVIQSNDPDRKFYRFTVQGTGDFSVPMPDIHLMKDTTPLANGLGSYSFSGVTLGYSSAPEVFTIQNTGNAALNITGVALASGDISDFTVDGSSLSSPVSQGSSTTFSITFTPTLLGSRQATVMITSDDPDETPYSFEVTGTGEPPLPDINVRQGSTQLPDGSGNFDLGGVIVGSAGPPVTFTIENLGDEILNISNISSSNPAEFLPNESSTDFTLNPGQTTTFTVEFAPQSTGSKSATITVSSDDPNESTYDFTVMGTGQPVPAPDIRVERASTYVPDGTGSISFSNVLLGSSSSPVAVTVINNGTADLAVNDIDLTAGDVSDFSISGTPLDITLAPGESDTFTITFTPTASGSRTATVEIVSDDPDENPYDFAVTGFGETPVPEIHVKRGSTDIASGSTGYSYGTILVGESSPDITFTIENLGTAMLTINDVYLDSGEFSIDYSSLTMTVASEGSTSFEVNFSPTSAGSKTTTVYILSDDADESTYTFTLTGIGQTPPDVEIELQVDSSYYADDTTYYFGDVTVLTSSIKTFVIENYGSEPLEIFNIFLTTGDSADFTRDTTSTILSPSTVPPGGSTTFTVTFTPQANGIRYRNLEINSNDYDESPYNIRLEGNGD